MNEKGYVIAPEWAQACMVIGDMLRTFAGRGTRTLISLTAEQSDAVRFADAFMDSRSSDLATILLERLLAPLDAMAYCKDEKCIAKNPGCHIHKPDVAAALVHGWVEIGTERATAFHCVEVLDGAWKVLSDLARSTNHVGGRAFLDALAESAFVKAREIVQAEIPAHAPEVAKEELEQIARLMHDSFYGAESEEGTILLFNCRHEKEKGAWFAAARAVLAARKGKAGNTQDDR